MTKKNTNTDENENLERDNQGLSEGLTENLVHDYITNQPMNPCCYKA